MIYSMILTALIFFALFALWEKQNHRLVRAKVRITKNRRPRRF